MVKALPVITASSVPFCTYNFRACTSSEIPLEMWFLFLAETSGLSLLTSYPSSVKMSEEAFFKHHHNSRLFCWVSFSAGFLGSVIFYCWREWNSAGPVLRFRRELWVTGLRGWARLLWRYLLWPSDEKVCLKVLKVFLSLLWMFF